MFAGPACDHFSSVHFSLDAGKKSTKVKNYSMSPKLSGCTFTHFKSVADFCLLLMLKIATLEHIKKLTLPFSFQILRICGLEHEENLRISDLRINHYKFADLRFADWHT
jgi:hypothetical protein